MQTHTSNFGVASIRRMFDVSRFGAPWLNSDFREDAGETMRSMPSERIAALIEELRKTQEALSPKQNELLRAIVLNDSRERRLRQEVNGLSATVMLILDELQAEMQRQRFGE
jgi:hypothetical protein